MKDKITGKMLKIYKTDDGITFKVKVQPGTVKNEIVGVQGDALKIKINAPPIKGKANKALINFLAKELGRKKSEVEILNGYTGRLKTIKVIGEGSEIEEKIQAIINIIRSPNTLEKFRGILRGTKLDNVREKS